jgi:hypothetical protein
MEELAAGLRKSIRAGRLARRREAIGSMEEQRSLGLRDTERTRMSPEPEVSQNVELLRRVVDAYNARDIEELISYCDPSVEFHSAYAAIGGAVYHGHDGMRSWHRDVQDVWGDETRLEQEAYFDLGEQTLAFYVLRGRGQQSGVEVAMPNALVARWRGGLMVYIKGYVQREEALSDLGVAEDELEPIDP